MNDVRHWLDQHGLAELLEVFERERIDLQAARNLTDSDLKELGLPLGLRTKLRVAIQDLQSSGSTAIATEDAPALPLQAERRQLTILFCDLVGSTALSAKLDPEALSGLMQDYRKAATGVVARYEGFVAQYLGDGLMIYFGWPKAHEDDASRSVLSALEILAALSQISSAEPLRARIGIATGTVVVGQDSADTHGEGGLAVGETPNLAARLQGVAGLHEIVIASSTRRLIGEAFHLADLGELTLKGVLQPVRGFKVLGSRRVEGRFDASHGHRLTALIGRESEISLFLDRWERVKTGEGQVVMLSAEAGVGKSRVTRALRDHIADEAHTALQYQCSAIHSNSAFYPVIEQFERAAQFVSNDTPAQKLAKMEALLAEAQVNVVETAPLYAAMLSLPTDVYPDLRLSPQQQKERTIAAQVEYVIGLARHRPVLMVLEDVHWADPSTLEAFGVLLEQLDSSRVLLVITYRPEFSPPWKSQSRVTALTLARLSRKETALLAERVAGKPLPPDVTEQILAKTDGIPLFVEELTKVVMESSLMHDAGDRFTINEPLPPLAIPSSLHDSLMARLDRMAPVKELIQLGAVIGREFSHKLIESLSSMPATQLEAALGQLVTSELIFKRGTATDGVYIFKHALIQDAAYESILRSRRQQLHANVAATLEKDTQIAQSDPGLLALQFEKAGLAEKAIEWYMKAGLLAKRQFANVEASRSFERVLRLVDGLAPCEQTIRTRVHAHTEIGMVATMLEGYHSEYGMKHFVEAERLSREITDVSMRFRALVGVVHSSQWRRMDSRALEAELIKIGDQSDLRVHQLYAAALRAQANMFSGRYIEARTEFELVQTLYEEERDKEFAFEYSYDPGVGALNSLAYMQWETGFFDSALATSDKFVRISEKIGHPYSRAFAFAWTSDLAYFMWNIDRVRHFSDVGVEFCKRHGFSFMHALCMFHQGWAWAQQGRWSEAIETMSAALDQYRQAGQAAVFVSRMIAQLASVYGLADRGDEGLRILESSPDRQDGMRRVRYPEISRIEGDLHRLKRSPDLDLAEHSYQEAISISLEDGNRAKQLRATTSLAQLWHSQGRIAEARTLLQPLYVTFTEGFDVPDMKNARRLLETLNEPS